MRFLGWHLHMLEEQLVGLVVDHDTNRLHGESVAECCMQVHEEDRKPLRLLPGLVKWSGPGKKNHQVRVPHARDVDLPAVYNVAIALAYRRRCNTHGIRACFRFGHSKRLQAQFATGNFGQVGLLLHLGPMPQECPHRVHLRVAGPSIATGSINLLQDDRCFNEAHTPSSVLPRNKRPRYPASVNVWTKAPDTLVAGRALSSNSRETAGRASAPPAAVLHAILLEPYLPPQFLNERYYEDMSTTRNDSKRENKHVSSLLLSPSQAVSHAYHCFLST